MVVLVNSSFHNVGASTLSYMITKMYGNLMNQPSLVMNLGAPDFYKSAVKIDKDYDFQTVSMVLNKTRGKDSFRPSTFKLEDTVFYYNAKGASLSDEMSRKVLSDLIVRTSREFGMVVVDIDIRINGFIKLVPVADKILMATPPDVNAMRRTQEMVDTLRLQYEETEGVAIKPDIIYVVCKHDGTPSLNQAYKYLETRAHSCCSIKYSKELAIQRNAGRLDHFVADLMINPKTPELRQLLINYRTLINKISPIKLPTRKVVKKEGS